MLGRERRLRGVLLAGILVCAGSLLLGGRGPATADPGAWDVQERHGHLLPTELTPADFVPSPGARHLAYVRRLEDGRHLVLDGTPGPAFQVVEAFRFAARDGGFAYLGAGERGVEIVTAKGRFGPYRQLQPATLALSEDGSTVAYVAEAPDQADGTSSGRMAAYRNGAAAASEASIEALALGGDGSRLAYVTREGSKQRVVTDAGARGEPFDEVDPASLRVSARAGGVAYTARREKSWHVVVGDAVGPAVARAGGKYLALSEDGARWACWVGVGPKPRYVVDGKEQPLFDLVGDYAPRFSPDGSRFVYGGQREGRWHVIVEDQIHSSWTGIAGHDIQCSRDGAVLVFAAQRDGRWWVQAGAKAYGPYDGVGDELLRVSADGAHSAFAARRGASWFVLHDGRESEPVDTVTALALSADGGHVAYGAVRAGAYALHVDDERVENRLVLPGGLAFDAQGVLHAVTAEVAEPPRLGLLELRLRPR